jgi:hypothetical protein
MPNKTLNNIIDKIEQLADQHEMLEDHGNGHTANVGQSLDENRQLLYPYLWTDYKDTKYILSKNQRGIAFKLYSFSVMVLDKYSPNVKNSQEVMSDTEYILSDIVQKLVNDRKLREFQIDVTAITALPVRDEDKDGVEGWLAVVAFKIPYQFCHKNLPITE